ncbi:MAG: arabinogalactan endo-1,4-beta-galactosidase [Balneolaceae bacterium]
MTNLSIYLLLLFTLSCNEKSNPITEEPIETLNENFVFGADLSYVNQILDFDGVYKMDGEEKDPYQIFADYGTTTARFRLFKDPTWTKEVYGENGTQYYNEINDVKTAIVKTKEAGMTTLLDYHYSDMWADPGRQEVPAAWEGLEIEAVGDSIYQYTYNTLMYLYRENALPEMVQVGNENNCGLVHPYANVCESDEWEELGTLLNRGIDAVRDIENATNKEITVMLHVAQPENVNHWFDNVISVGKVTDFEVIGFSYYPKWSEIPINRISNYVGNFRVLYDREIMILETAYPWTLTNADGYGNILGEDSLIEGYDASQEGQKQFMIDLTQEVINGGGSGIFYWEPAWITSNLKDLWGQGSSWENNAFFDFEGNVHTGIDFMKYEYDFGQ